MFKRKKDHFALPASAVVHVHGEGFQAKTFVHVHGGEDGANPKDLEAM